MRTQSAFHSLIILIVIGFGLALFPLESTHAAPKITEYRLIIPALKLDQTVVRAPIFRHTWSFTHIVWSAGYLEGRPLPGSRNNVAIGAHSELAARAPGPFYHLDQLRAGDAIFIRYNGRTFRYRVERSWVTVPTDSTPIAQAEQEMLTLFTCSAYNPEFFRYDARLIVRARYIPPYPLPSSQ
jgi:LPXTG-site transpeptidase (sortase) family protein